jgi:hypothetical protein
MAASAPSIIFLIKKRYDHSTNNCGDMSASPTVCKPASTPYVMDIGRRYRTLQEFLLNYLGKGLLALVNYLGTLTLPVITSPVSRVDFL